MTIEEAKKKIKKFCVYDYCVMTDEEFREYKKAIETILEELEKKNKIIDGMVITMSMIETDLEVVKRQFKEKYCEFINSDDDCCWKTDKMCSDCIKEYFEKKVEKEENDKMTVEEMKETLGDKWQIV